MKRIIVFLLALSVSGCANGFPDFSKSILAGGASIIQKTHNPITEDMLYGIENSFIVVFAGLVTYRRECIKAREAARVTKQPVDNLFTNCHEVIVNIQKFTRPAKDKLLALRIFVRKNDQINAIDVYNQLQDILATVIAVKKSAGVN